MAVSLGFYKTLFSAPGTSTFSEIPMEEQLEMGLSNGLIRFSIGLDDHIDRIYIAMKDCLIQLGILKKIESGGVILCLQNRLQNRNITKKLIATRCKTLAPIPLDLKMNIL